MTRAELIATLRAVADECGETLLREAADALEAERRDAAAFLAAEAVRFTKAANNFDEQRAHEAAERCETKAGAARTWAAYIERGDYEGASS